jgi:hypothetical protein
MRVAHKVWNEAEFVLWLQGNHETAGGSFMRVAEHVLC